MEQKLCRICGKLKILDSFPKHKKMKDGYRNECKECSNKTLNRKRMKELDLQREIKMEGTKICLFCELEKDIKDFCIRRRSLDGRCNKCKECSKIILKKYKEVDGFKEKEKEYDKKRYDELREQILQRKKEYHVENREKILAHKKEYRSTDEFKVISKQWKDKNIDKIRENSREYNKNNKDKMAAIQVRYRENHPHIIAWRSILYSTLKRLGTIKQGHTIEMLGYSALDLKHHIENQFQTGMTWKNHGEWHIDHISQVITFPTDAPMKEVCALENLRPLWATTREINGVIYEGNLNRSKF